MSTSDFFATWGVADTSPLFSVFRLCFGRKKMNYQLVYSHGDEVTAYEGDLEYFKENDFCGLREYLSGEEYDALVVILAADFFTDCEFGDDDFGWTIAKIYAL